jgi:type 1 glutamine amidotransferase
VRLLKKSLRILLVFALFWLVASLAAVWYFNAWRIIFPSHKHETIPPVLPADLAQPAVMLFTKTNSFRHVEAIPAGVALFTELAEARGWGVFHTENSAIFNDEQLARFSAVVFHNASGDSLSLDQRASFESWLEGGGGWLGVHSAGDDSHAYWPWYMKNLVGAEFTAHILGPQFQQAKVLTEAPDHPAMRGVPADWLHTEEWYSWKESPRGKGFTILATVDEESYTPVQNLFVRQRDLRMGDHPVIWSRCLGTGRVLYSALGHQAEAYAVPEYMQILENALDWVMDERVCAP